jgi:TonB family protein
MKVDKNDMTALAATILIHLLIALLLFLAVLRTIVPEEEEGVLVNFGNVDAAAGLFEPRGRTAPVETAPPEPAVPTPPGEIISQDTEETVTLSERRRQEERKKKEDAERREHERRQAEQRRQDDLRRQREQAISDQVSGAFGTGNTDSPGQGDAQQGDGNQGSPFGNADQGENRGAGGFGSFSLNGRTLRGGGLPRPAYTIQDEGRIVIDITVDPKGNVTNATIGKGTNIDHASMRNSALEAARRATFNSIKSTNNQSGTITYRYSLK